MGSRAFQHKLETPEERLRAFDRVTAEEIRTVARLVFQPKRTAAAIIGPCTKSSKLLDLFRFHP